MIDLFRTIIIPAQHVTLARDIAASFGPGGVGMFTTPLDHTFLNALKQKMKF